MRPRPQFVYKTQFGLAGETKSSAVLRASLTPLFWLLYMQGWANSTSPISSPSFTSSFHCSSYTTAQHSHHQVSPWPGWNNHTVTDIANKIIIASWVLQLNTCRNMAAIPVHRYSNSYTNWNMQLLSIYQALQFCMPSLIVPLISENHWCVWTNHHRHECLDCTLQPLYRVAYIATSYVSTMQGNHKL